MKDKHGAEIEELFGLEVQVPAIPFPRIPLAEALEIVKSRGYEIPRTDGDLDPEGERQISAYVEETYGHQFVFITDYHPEIRAFYHMRDEETGLTKSYDLLFKGVEITTGAQREHRVDVLIEQAKEKGLGRRAPRLLLRLLPLRRPAPRRLRHGPRARAHAAARRVVDPRGHLPLPRPDAPRSLTRRSAA